ncbi:cyclic pyranopterin monophosphate synthase MoaC [Labilibaculum sp. A4]|uniref:cyclic pyranopterin monophosphate synthase MoaC n=1 Tax=Labilibaculum euxinus TaxID=2686357 RepID=UPI000F626A65|nr:cyclic pyranopterin monophosphate synthase MoaC [Labilibaculum euxinus]MDQ1771097.1 cyclic pyranopterin monophosphate synthase MoaC [Labilibaculum euxinus]MWN76896.1 cyclic pyranopterin monophosphate synthase MoaC [Labilibaculum euxinus]
MGDFSHIDKDGKANMVDVGDKIPQIREAKAIGIIHLEARTIELIQENAMKKGDALTIAEIAGIQAAKRTSDLIPLCHTLQITKAEVKCSIIEKGVQVNTRVKCIGQTGVEMEALTAASIALLTIYDMCKAVDKSMVLGEIALVEKTKTDLKQ